MARRVLHPDAGEEAATSRRWRATIADPDVAAMTTAGHSDRIRPHVAIDEGCR